MANVLALVKDDRVRRQIELYFNELDVADVRFATFASVKEFQEIYFRDKSAEENLAPPDQENLEDEGAELKMFSEINLIVFALDTIEEKLPIWITKVRAAMYKFKRMPEEGDLRLVLLKYEDDNISKLDVVHPHLDDLIFLPLDRLVFLQKMQIFLSLPKRVSPTYLFNQEVKQNIEISKITKLERLSDVALAIRNPLPLKRGLPGHFYLTFPGEKARLEIKAKVLRSMPHPEVPGQYLVYFTYFGLSKTNLSQIRRALSKSPQYKSLLFDDRNRFRFRNEDLFLESIDRHEFGTLVIDSDEVTGNSLAQTLKKEMDRLQVATESSYSLFLHRYLSADNEASKGSVAPKPTESSDFYRNPISLTVSHSDLKLLSVDPGPSDASLLFGHSAILLFSTPENWLTIIEDRASRVVLEEAVQMALRGRVMEKLLNIQDMQGQKRAVNFKIYQGETDSTVTIEISPASLTDILAKARTEQINKALEVLIVDTAFVPEDPTAWIEGLRQRAAQVGLVKKPTDLKFWLTSESEEINPNYLNNSDMLGLFIKPVDQRQILFSLSEHLPNPNTMYQFDNLGWTQPSLPIHVSKGIELDALSEYGATLRSQQKILPGSMIYLRKSIFENAPNGCLSARVYACEEHPEDKSTFLIYMTYFGINDAFLKYARTWIRENYAHQKSQG